jgi:hypothetical protein
MWIHGHVHLVTMPYMYTWLHCQCTRMHVSILTWFRFNATVDRTEARNVQTKFWALARDPTSFTLARAQLNSLLRSIAWNQIWNLAYSKKRAQSRLSWRIRSQIRISFRVWIGGAGEFIYFMKTSENENLPLLSLTADSHLVSFPMNSFFRLFICYILEVEGTRLKSTGYSETYIIIILKILDHLIPWCRALLPALLLQGPLAPSRRWNFGKFFKHSEVVIHTVRLCYRKVLLQF